MLSKLLYSLLPCLRREGEDADRSFLDNGSQLLEDLIASCDGKSNPIRHYSADELVRATNNFHPSYLIAKDSWSWLYAGFLDNRWVMIKRGDLRDDAISDRDDAIRDDAISDRDDAISDSYYAISDSDDAISCCYAYSDTDCAIRDIIISMQMSTHKNVLKLLGCCLEFRVPALVHEYAAKGVLNGEGGYGDNESLPWKTRLRIAKQLANAITYLHTAFPRPIIHRDIKPTNIFLDHDYVPKISDFSLSITIPPEQSHVADVQRGTFGYIDPAYLKSPYITEKTDVYSFGVILLVFLSGRAVLERNQAGEEFELVSYVRLHASDDQFLTIVDPKILEEIKGEDEQAQQQQLHDFLALALLCTREEPERRPDMIDVAKELIRIEKSINPC